MPDVDPSDDLPPDHQVVDVHGMSFREFAAINGDSEPDETWLPEDVVAWFLDARADSE